MKKIIALCLIAVLCFSLAACSAGFKTQTVQLGNGETPTVSISGSKGYSFELRNGEIQFMKNEQTVATGRWQAMEFYSQYINSLENEYEEINVANKKADWRIFQSRTSPDKVVMILEYNNKKVFFYAVSNTVEDAKNIAQCAKVK